MKAKPIFFAGIVMILVLIVFYAFTDTQSDEKYIKKIEGDRQKRNLDFKNSQDSPLSDKTNFTALNYFGVDADFRIKAKLERMQSTAVYLMQMTQSDPERYEKYGYASFNYQGKKYKLLLLRKIGDRQLFLAFKDATNGKSTYKGGRYLNIQIPKNDELELDFNYAINPFCVYNEEYSCPLPPQENRLDFEVKAGEKMYGQ